MRRRTKEDSVWGGAGAGRVDRVVKSMISRRLQIKVCDKMFLGQSLQVSYLLQSYGPLIWFANAKTNIKVPNI